MIPVNSFHIELTNKCYLKCPRCARTTFIEKFGSKRYTNHDLNFDHFKSFFDIDISNKKFNFVGNYGDPIYHPNVFQFIKFIKDYNSSLKLVTNGSYKTKKWWKELISILDYNDSVTFSIDGIPENFTQYRKNADWETIKNGLEVIGNSNVNSEWSYIPFSYNINTIDEARKLSNSFGIKKFNVSPSNRWEDDNDWLKPEKNYLNKETEKKIEWKFKNKNIEIDPKCVNGTQHYISAEGYYMPCCFVGDWRFYYKSEFYKNKQKYDISKTTMSEIINITNTFYDNLDTNDYCQFSCPKV
jgi:MoaA/NifB/PqqE/SkfB family radical SAM enzyme